MEWLTYFGITPSQLTPVALIAGIFGFCQWKWLLKHIKQEVTDLHNATWEMQHHLKNKKSYKFNPLHNLDKLSLSYGNSPFKMNDNGKDLFEKSGIKEMIANNSDELIKRLDEIGPKTAYDVEQESFNVLSNLVTESEILLTEIKKYIYNNPVHAGREVVPDSIFFVGSLDLRDRYLAIHPEIQ